MEHENYTIEDLAKRLGKDKREVEKLASRGRIPGRKVGGVWQFHPTEITRWLEGALKDYSDVELATIEEKHQSAEVDAEVPVSSLLTPETMQIPMEGRTKRSVLENLIEVAGRTWHVWEPATVLKAVQDREEVLSTGMENGAAIPHPRNTLPDVLGQSVVAFGRTSSGIPFGAPKRMLTDIFFLVLCRDSRTHLQILARLARMMQLPNFLDDLRSAQTSAEAYRIVCEAEEKVGK